MDQQGWIALGVAFGLIVAIFATFVSFVLAVNGVVYQRPIQVAQGATLWLLVVMAMAAVVRWLR